uniref:CRM domain-containing protein n=1 Tax=Steinernema glaseri TaxID=37863 RepID=A0A1I7ZZY5_9BILA
MDTVPFLFRDSVASTLRTLPEPCHFDRLWEHAFANHRKNRQERSLIIGYHRGNWSCSTRRYFRDVHFREVTILANSSRKLCKYFKTILKSEYLKKVTLQSAGGWPEEILGMLEANMRVATVQNRTDFVGSDRLSHGRINKMLKFVKPFLNDAKLHFENRPRTSKTLTKYLKYFRDIHFREVTILANSSRKLCKYLKTILKSEYLKKVTLQSAGGWPEDILGMLEANMRVGTIQKRTVRSLLNPDIVFFR